MAQYLAGTANGPGAPYDFIQKLTSHMVTNGWTKLYTQNATPDVGYDIYMQGGALDAVADNRPIIRITWTSATRITFRCCADWDPGALVGIGEVGNASYSFLDVVDSTFAFWIKVNPVAVAYVIKNGANYNHSYCGFLRRGLSPSKSGITKTTTSLAIGSTSLPVASSMVGKIKLGQKIHIFNNSHNNSSANKLNGEMITVTSVAAGAIGCSALVKTYDSDALVGENPYPCIVASQVSNSSPVGGQVMTPRYLDGSPTGTATSYASSYTTPSSYAASTSPSYTQDYVPGIHSIYTNVSGKSGFMGYPYHFETCSAGIQSGEDFMDDGEKTYLVIATYGSNVLLLGPRED